MIHVRGEQTFIVQFVARFTLKVALSALTIHLFYQMDNANDR